MTDMTWRPGDRVVHATKPEWGTGSVVSATSFRIDGKDAQRLTIRFERAGTKTISTAVATLVSADQAPAAMIRETKPSIETAKNSAPRGGPGKEELAALLVQIPDAASDPFRPLGTRLEQTVGLYRFEPKGKDLLDWAAAQTGLADPLSQFSRHDLEEAFERFRTKRESHLRELVRQARRDEPAALSGLGNKVTPHVRELLTKMLTER